MLNTYQHADCEHKFAQRELLTLNETTNQLEKNAIKFGLNKQLAKAQKSFMEFVDADCLLKGDATLGTMGTYIIEECKSSYYKTREKEMSTILRNLNE